MIQVNQTYNDILSNGGNYEWQIKNGSNTFGKDKLISGTITATQYEQLSVGNVIASQVDLKLWNVTVDTSSSLIVQFRATDGSSTSSWYTKGIYYIDTVETSPYSEVTHITGFDSMLKAEVVYLKTGTWTNRTTCQVLTQVASDMGVSVESATSTLISDNPITITSAPSMGENGTTDREMLSLIASLYSGNFVIDSAGKLKLIRLSVTPSNTAAVGDSVAQFEASPVETIKRVRVWISDTKYYAFPEVSLHTHEDDIITTHVPQDISVRAAQFPQEWEAIGGKLIDIDVPIVISYANAKSIFNSLLNKAFAPYTAQEAYVDPKYEVGDGVTIKGITSVIASQVLSIDALSSSNLIFKGEEVLNSYYPYVNPVEKQISRAEARTQASITVLDDRITSEVQTLTASDADLRSSITQTSAEIAAEVEARYDNDIASVQPQYYVSTSNTTQTGGSWGNVIPTLPNEENPTTKYLWTRYKLTYNDANITPTYTTPVLGTDNLYRNVVSNNSSLIIQSNQIASKVDSTYVQAQLGTNLAPFFSQPVEDVYDADDNPNGYWAVVSSYISTDTDGWASVVCNNSSGSDDAYAVFFVRYDSDYYSYTEDSYKALIEIANASISGGNCAVWFADTSGTRIPVYKASSYSPNQSFNGATTKTATLAKTNNSSPNLWFRSGITVPAGVNASFKIRVSLFRSDYAGSYTPYVMSGAYLVNNYSTITQTASSISSEVQSITTNISETARDLQQDIEDATSGIPDIETAVSNLQQTATDFEASLSTKITKSDADDSATAATTAFSEELKTYLRYYIQNNTGIVELGDNTSGYVAKLNNQKLAFLDNGTEVAYISNNKLYITNAEITNNLQIGHYQWITDSTGRMSLKWVG